MKEFTPEELSKLTYSFLQTDYGQHYLAWLSGLYSDTHQATERDGLSPNDISALVNQAKGIKIIIDNFVTFQKLYEQDAFQERKQKDM